MGAPCDREIHRLAQGPRRRGWRTLFEERAAGIAREAFRVKIAEIASRRGGGWSPGRSLYVTVVSRHLARPWHLVSAALSYIWTPCWLFTAVTFVRTDDGTFSYQKMKLDRSFPSPAARPESRLSRAGDTRGWWTKWGRRNGGSYAIRCCKADGDGMSWEVDGLMDWFALEGWLYVSVDSNNS